MGERLWMENQRQFALQLLVSVIVIYALLVGGTFNGLVSVEISQVSLIMLTAGLVGWLALRRWLRFRWRATPLDGLALAGVGVLILTTLPNLESWRRIAIGAWYWGLYLLVWWAVADLIANGLPRRWLVNALLVSGGLVILLGYIQVYPWLLEWARLKGTGIALPFSPPRPSSAIGNPNALGTLLIVVILLAWGRGAQARRWLAMASWAAYVLSGGGLLFLSLSRGAWVGAAGGGLFWLGVLAADAGLFSARFWRGRWQIAPPATRALAGIGLAGAIMLLAVGALAALRIANQPGRSFQTTRAIVYHAAIEEFKTSPLTGHGLFTFGKQLLGYHSTPPQTPHSHAHNLILHVGVQLGLLGLLLLGWCAALVFRAWRRRLHRLAGPARLEHAALGAALLAITIHHMFDITTMMPALGLVWLLVLACTTLEDATIRMPSGRWHWQTPVIVGMMLLVLGAGWGSQRLQQRYFDALRLADSGAWQAAARELDAVVARDPALALYAAEQGYLWGVAAYRGSGSAVAPGIAALEQALEAEAVYAPWHANLAALYWQQGESETAITTLRQAIAHAPSSAVLWLNLGLWAEQRGDLLTAHEAYAHVLEFSEATGLAFWSETAPRQTVLEEFLAGLDTPPLLPQVVNLLASGEGQAALTLLLENPAPEPDNLWWRVMCAIAHEAVGEPLLADQWLATARFYQQTEEHAAWLAVGRAVLAAYRDDPEAAALTAAAQEIFALTERGAGFVYGENLAWFNFYRGTFSPQFLPQLATIHPAWKAQYTLATLMQPPQDIVVSSSMVEYRPVRSPNCFWDYITPHHEDEACPFPH